MRVKVHLTVIPLFFVLAALYLQACSVSGDGTDTQSGTGTDNDGPPQLTLATATGLLVLPADGTSSVTIQLTVSDANGQAIANTPVTFTTSAGTLANGSTSATARTNNSGVAQAILTSGTQAARATVRAEAMGFSVSIAVQFVGGAPDALELSATPDTVNTGETAIIEATVRDANNNLASGIPVTFDLSTNASGAGLSASSGVTDGNGIVRVTYTAGQTAGTDTVQAEAGGLAETVEITVEASQGPGGTEIDSLELLVSSPQLDSGGVETVTLTALVRDENNNFVPEIPVTFAADSGGIEVTQGTTDASGTATATLGTAGDPTSRVIEVTARAGGISSSNLVTVTGTTLTISGAGTLVLGQTTRLSILLRNSDGNGIPTETIQLNSTLGNELSADSLATDFNGQAQVDVTATVDGNDTIQATALGVAGSFTLTVSADNFVFTSPAPMPTPPEVNLGEANAITLRVHWDKNGTPQANQRINFFATRGTLEPTFASTNAAGNAQVTIFSTTAGPAVITAVAAAGPGGPSSQVEIEFVAIDPTSLILQANPTSLGVNTPGTEDQQSIITAVVRDEDGNLVKNQTVSFLLTGGGGRIFPASAITDSFGRASTVYTAGATPSAQDGVVIDAEVVDPPPERECERDPNSTPPNAPVAGPCHRVTLTVARQALFVVLGTSHLLTALDATRYSKPYNVLVTDANSNPVAGARVELNIFPTRYQKGFYTLFFDDAGNCTGWDKVLTVSGADPLRVADDRDRACNNEDRNRNGLLDPARGNNEKEDLNENNVLDPGDVATTDLLSVTTDSTGFGLFNVVYSREFTWVEIELEARTNVAGSEASSKARFFLPGLASDFNDCEASPPGQVSRYGLARTCDCDELIDTNQATCPTIAGSTTPVLVAPAGIIPVLRTGGQVRLTLSGGVELQYSVQFIPGENTDTGIGTLRNIETNVTSTTIVPANFGEVVSLTLGALPGAVVITTHTVRVVDTLTNQFTEFDIQQGN